MLEAVCAPVPARSSLHVNRSLQERAIGQAVWGQRASDAPIIEFSAINLWNASPRHQRYLYPIQTRRCEPAWQSGVKPVAWSALYRRT